MRRPRRPLFLARRPYRKRRLRDAARLLPVFGGVLLLLPVMWSPPGQGMRQLSGDVFYFFALWLVLIAIAALFARGLTEEEGELEEEEIPPGLTEAGHRAGVAGEGRAPAFGAGMAASAKELQGRAPSDGPEDRRGPPAVGDGATAGGAHPVKSADLSDTSANAPATPRPPSDGGR